MKFFTLASVSSIVVLAAAIPPEMNAENEPALQLSRRSGEAVYLVNCGIAGAGVSYSVMDV
jgi:hypothetical protein